MERICELCERKFEQHEMNHPQKRCPTCKDIMQRRPTVVIRREVTREFPQVLIDFLPGPWQFSKPFFQQDHGCFKIDQKGSSLTGEGFWTGRTVIRASMPFKRGGVVAMRCMKAIHLDRHTGKPRTREYVVLGVAKTVSRPIILPQLVWITVDLSMEKCLNNSLWSRTVYGGGETKEGPFTEEGILAVIDKHHPLIIQTKDAGTYSLPEG